MKIRTYSVRVAVRDSESSAETSTFVQRAIDVAMAAAVAAGPCCRTAHVVKVGEREVGVADPTDQRSGEEWGDLADRAVRP